MSTQVTPIPEGYHNLTPYLIVKDGAAAVSFYEKAFKAIREGVMEESGGKIRHAELKIGDSHLMLGEHAEVDEPRDKQLPRVSIYMYVENADDVMASATAAGAKVSSPLKTQYYGNREGGIEDPFGIVWWIASRVESVSGEEVARRAAQQKPA
jgi:PhnB protein